MIETAKVPSGRITLSPPVPDADGVDAAWLTAALRRAGFEVEVVSFEAKPIGMGQVGDTYRYTIDYRGAASADAPRTLIGKHHSSNAASRAVAHQLGLYRNEYMFYRDLAPSVGATIARPFDVVNDDEGRFVLLLEDLAPAMPCDQLTGISGDLARLAVREAAKLHASHWGDDALAGNGWINARPLAQGVASPDQLAPCWPAFEERFADLVPKRHMEVAAAFVRDCHMWNRPLRGPRSLTHNDFRPDNFMVAGAEGGKPLTIVDWQTLSFNYGVLDVAYLLGGSFEGEERWRLEQELLPEYHDALRAFGVEGYDFETFRRHYRHFTFAGLTVTIVAAMSVKRTERGDRLFTAMLNRHCSHILDQDALPLLGKSE